MHKLNKDKPPLSKRDIKEYNKADIELYKFAQEIYNERNTYDNL